MRQRPLSRTFIAVAVVLATVSIGARTDVSADVPGTPPRPAVVPALVVTRVVSNLVNPWDIAFTPDGTMFYTERPGRIGVRLTNGIVRQLTANMGDLWVSGETGLMGIEVDPDFDQNRRVYTCQGTTDGNYSVQVVAWVADAGLTRLDRVNDPLVGGIDGSTGRHGGCQLRIDTNGYLRIGTGDAATGTNPQNLASLAGKTLRVSRFDGTGVAGNITNGDGRIFTYGHRNVQGLAVAPSGAIFSVEHGTDRDDEINALRAGANYGWDPVPGYDERRPMTDLAKFPQAVPAVWSSGYPTIAPSGATFLLGRRWGDFQGALAVAVLKNRQLRIFAVSGSTITAQWIPAELNGTFGRLRGAEMGPDGSLYLTTDNGSADAVLRVTPSGATAGREDVLLRYGSGLNWNWEVGASTGSDFAYAGNWLWGRGGTAEPVYVGNFNGDARDDVLLRYGTGLNYIWDVGLSTGTGFTPAGNWYWGRGGTAEPVYIGDFNGDGRDDVLLRYGTGLNYIWDVGLSTGGGFSAAGNWYWGRGGTAEPVYIGDFTGDGRDDVLLRYGSGLNWIWDVGRSTGSDFTPAGNWYWGRGGTAEPVYIGDFNGDGRDDVLLRYGTGLNYIWDVGLSTGTGFTPAGNWYWGRGGTAEPVYIGDFNGDGRDDVLLRYGSGLNYIWDVGLSTGSGFTPAGNWYWGRGGTAEPVYVGQYG